MGSVAGSRPASSAIVRRRATPSASSTRSSPGQQQRHPAVGAADHAAQRPRRGAAPDPDRDRSGGERVDPDPVEVVEPAVEGHQRLGPQAAHDLDLLLQPVLAGGEVGAQALVLGPAPAHADGQPQSARAEQVDGGHLLGHQRGRPLGRTSTLVTSSMRSVTAARWPNRTKTSWKVCSSV